MAYSYLCWKAASSIFAVSLHAEAKDGCISCANKRDLDGSLAVCAGPKLTSSKLEILLLAEIQPIQ